MFKVKYKKDHKELCAPRGVLRTLSNIYHGTIFVFRPLTIFTITSSFMLERVCFIQTITEINTKWCQ